MRRWWLLLFPLLLSASTQIEIESLHFTSDESQGVTRFTGNVVIRRGEDVMRADTINVHADNEKNIDRFEAEGNTSFTIHLDANKTFQGSADRFIYLPKKKEYLLLGNAVVQDMNNTRKIIGEEIIINEESKTAHVSGREKKPVKLIFTIEEEPRNGGETNRTQ